MDPELVAQSLNFHGQQLTKVLENEKGPNFLQGVPPRDLDYQVFQKRSKEIGYVDDAWIYHVYPTSTVTKALILFPKVSG